MVSMKILKKLIDVYPSSPSSIEDYTKSSLIELLCKKENLIEVLIENLKIMKKNLIDKIKENDKKIIESNLDEFINDSKTGYIQELSDRINFIHYSIYFLLIFQKNKNFHIF